MFTWRVDLALAMEVILPFLQPVKLFYPPLMVVVAAAVLSLLWLMERIIELQHSQVAMRLMAKLILHLTAIHLPLVVWAL